MELIGLAFEVISAKYQAMFYHECTTVEQLKMSCFFLLKKLGCPAKYKLESQVVKTMISNLGVLPPAQKHARDFFDDFCIATKTAEAYRGTLFCWCWKNFCCWMYEVTHKSSTADGPECHMFAFLATRRQEPSPGARQDIVPYEVIQVVNPDLAMTTPCYLCSKPQQRNVCTEVELTDDIEGTAHVTKYTMHRQCYEFLRCWTDIHRIKERVDVAMEREGHKFNALKFYDEMVCPKFTWMFEHLSKRKLIEKSKKGQKKGEACSPQEQHIVDFFFSGAQRH